jgi:tRNA (guanine37-N1)-methyltransferase
VKAFNEDGREFIRKSGRRMKDWRDIQKEVETPSKRAFGPAYRKKTPPRVKEVIPVPEIISHFVMNLPATAIEFLGMNRYDWDLTFRCVQGIV